MGTPKSVLNTTNTLNLRVQHLEALCRDLQKEKNVMEEQFGVQRKRFMDFMMQKDSELSVVKKSVEKFSSEALRLSQQLRLREEEVRCEGEALGNASVVDECMLSRCNHAGCCSEVCTGSRDVGSH